MAGIFNYDYFFNTQPNWPTKGINCKWYVCTYVALGGIVLMSRIIFSVVNVL